MSRIHRMAILAVLISQAGFLAGMITLHEYRSANWQKVRLRTEPVDPASLFRGRYVWLGYEFNRLETKDQAWMGGDEVLIRLAPGRDGIWRMQEFGRSLAQRSGSALLRGRVTYLAGRHWWQSGPKKNGKYTLHIKLPIQSYFLSERRAAQIERLQANRKAEVTVDVVLAPDGRSQLEQLYVDGVPAEDYQP